jgi:hypothetical protein
MSNPNHLGSESQSIVSLKNDNSLAASLTERIAATGLQIIREFFPTNQPESDAAARLRIELLAEVVAAVGSERFLRAVRDAIAVSRSRWDCSVAKIREMAGLRYEPPQSRVAAAWDFATQTFLNHARLDPEGRYRLEEKVVLRDGVAEVTPIPLVPPAVLRAVQALGGWSALADTSNWSYRFKDFRELYTENPNPHIDRPGSDLERAG